MCQFCRHEHLLVYHNHSTLQFGTPIESNQYNIQEVSTEVSRELRQLHAELENIYKLAESAQNGAQGLSLSESKKLNVSCYIL